MSKDPVLVVDTDRPCMLYVVIITSFSLLEFLLNIIINKKTNTYKAATSLALKHDYFQTFGLVDDEVGLSKDFSKIYLSFFRIASCLFVT